MNQLTRSVFFSQKLWSGHPGGGKGAGHEVILVPKSNSKGENQQLVCTVPVTVLDYNSVQCFRSYCIFQSSCKMSECQL